MYKLGVKRKSQKWQYVNVNDIVALQIIINNSLEDKQVESISVKKFVEEERSEENVQRQIY